MKRISVQLTQNKHFQVPVSREQAIDIYVSIKCFSGPWSIKCIKKNFQIIFFSNYSPLYIFQGGQYSLPKYSLFGIQSYTLHREAEYQNYENSLTFIKLVPTQMVFPFNTRAHLTCNFKCFRVYCHV